MFKSFLCTAAIASTAALGVALPSQALTFVPLDLSGIAPVTGTTPLNAPLLTARPYFDAITNLQIGTFDVIFKGALRPEPLKPRGDNQGNFNMGGLSTVGGVNSFMNVQFVFNGPRPFIQISNPTNNPPFTTNNFSGNDDNWKATVGHGPEWSVVNPDPNLLVTQISPTGRTIKWTYNGGTNQILSRNMDYAMQTNGGTGFLDLSFENDNPNVPNSNSIKVSVYAVAPVAEIPEPATALGSAIALGLGLLSTKRK